MRTATRSAQSGAGDSQAPDLIPVAVVGEAEGLVGPGDSGDGRGACPKAGSGIRKGLPVTAAISRAIPSTLLRSGRLGGTSRSKTTSLPERHRNSAKG